MKNNASLTTGDSREIILYDREETIDLFGEDYLEEFGVYVPEDVIELYKRVQAESRMIQDILRPIKKAKDSAW